MNKFKFIDGVQRISKLEEEKIEEKLNALEINIPKEQIQLFTESLASKTWNVVNWADFTPQALGVDVKPKGKSLCSDFISLDTETSHNHKSDKKEMIGWIYQWAFTYNGEIIEGRRPSEIIKCLKQIHETNKLVQNVKELIIFVHNLSYDWSYLKQWLRQEFKEKGTEEILAIGNHNIICYRIAGFDFRCSYKLTLKSLDSWSKELNTPHRKLVGAVDYDEIRYQDTPLTENDYKYMFNDVVVLDEAVRLQMFLHNDNLFSIPYTTTGYIRRKARQYCEIYKGRGQFKKMALTPEQYSLCRMEFAGGITHGNRLLANKTVRATIRHRDFVSHYPSQQVCSTAPCSPWVLEYDFENDGEYGGYTLKELISLASSRCILAEIKISNVKLKKGITLPYLQTSKCNNGRIDDIKTIDDNGRIMKLDGETIIAINEHDLKWLVKQYTFDIQILRVYSAKRGTFPRWLVALVMKLFYGKTEKKNAVKEIKKAGYKEDSIEYLIAKRNEMLAKGGLNGCFGMTATDPVRVSYEELDDGRWEVDKITTEFVEAKLSEFYSNWSSFMTYQLGVWTTSNARNELLEFVELVGYENFLYADTDSIFYISTPEIEKRIEDQNAKNREICDKEGHYIDFNGKRHYLNQFADEDEDIVAFRFLHAKCYAYEVKTENDIELKTTIAGVKQIGRENEDGHKVLRTEELGNIDNLKEGFVFKYCGGVQVVHTHAEPTVKEINGHLTEYASSAIIVNVEKTLHTELYYREHPIVDWSVEIEGNDII